MRCSCPNCGEFMEHAETSASCVCPNCLARCTACLGTDSVISRETFLRMRSDPSAGVSASCPTEASGADKE
ncbi:MAG: hypothetical protein IKP22_01710 [Clostridia bacterium]|nr:hypothetical protein [Clostridia bacterium]